MTQITKLKGRTIGGLVATSLAIVGSLVLAESASAAFGVRFSTVADFSSNTFTVFDGGGADVNSNSGTINIINANVGSNWTINLTGASSESPTAFLDIVTFNVDSAAAGTLYFEISDTGFTPKVEAFFSHLSSSDLAGTLSAKTWLGDGNTNFDKDILLSDLSAISPTGGSLGDLALFPAGGSDPYALTISGQLVHTGAASSDFNASIRGVPEPITFLGSGIALGFAGYLKRKLKDHCNA